ncbi:MAG TPA: maleylpyruvate isomerase N-terminal domain-containing protein [Propionibacteriaceae bacterium]|nr:maleylpyruvate isomerase N-terminal domain-containing protein [Propionibacteriaceae bacterium]
MIDAWNELDVREPFTEAARTFAELVGRIPENRWEGPGLGEWNLRSLVGHTSRSLITVETYLSQPVGTEEALTPAAYYVAVAGIDPRGVVGRGVAAGKALGDNPAELVDALAMRVPALVETAGNPVINTAAGGMRLENYLPTRSLELVVHSLDIAAAVPDIDGPEFSDQLLSQVARVAATAAVLQGRGVELMFALTGRAPLSPDFSIV